jgi:TRAP-type transport system small permease protein
VTSPNGAERFAAAVERAIDVLIAIALAVMVVTMVHQVFGRYVLGRAPSWSEELARFLMVWLTMLGSAAVLRSGSHIAVTVLTDALPPPLLRAALALRDAIVVAVCGVLVWWGVDFARLNGAQESAALEIPMTIPYAALPLGMALIVALVIAARLAGEPFPAVPGEEF